MARLRDEILNPPEHWWKKSLAELSGWRWQLSLRIDAIKVVCWFDGFDLDENRRLLVYKKNGRGVSFSTCKKWIMSNYRWDLQDTLGYIPVILEYDRGDVDGMYYSVDRAMRSVDGQSALGQGYGLAFRDFVKSNNRLPSVNETKKIVADEVEFERLVSFDTKGPYRSTAMRLLQSVNNMEGELRAQYQA